MTFKGVIAKFTAHELGEKNVTYNDASRAYIFNYPCYSRTECEPYELIMSPGTYKIELWGAQGGDARYQNQDNIRKGSGGKGAYVSGTIQLIGTTKLFLYIGGQGEDQSSIYQNVSRGGFNGGGDGGVDSCDINYTESGAGGGGSTDIRLYKSNDTKALRSRFIVAGAGGGAVSTDKTSEIYGSYLGGSAGKLHGNNSTIFGKGGGQGGQDDQGEFWKGGDGIGCNCSCNYGSATGGSGSGYYGGITTKPENSWFEYGGSGGSSYISGYEGCLSVLDLDGDDIVPTTTSIHYSNLFFNNTIMKSDAEDEGSFIDPYGNSEIGHSGNGAAKITIIKEEYSLPIFPSCLSTRPINIASALYVSLIFSK